MSADGKVVSQAGRNASKAYTAGMQNWNLYSLQSHCRVEYLDGEETCVEECCPAHFRGETQDVHWKVMFLV